jgi:hypothetical protein
LKPLKASSEIKKHFLSVVHGNSINSTGAVIIRVSIGRGGKH